jgi:hypothetical protein
MATQLINVLSRSEVHPAISMSGALRTNQLTGAVVGWIVTTWNDTGGMPPLGYKTHWVPKEGGKFMLLKADFGSSVEVFGEDTEMEPQRATFILATLTIWEQEYLKAKTN